MDATRNRQIASDASRRSIRDDARERQRAYVRGILASHPGITLSDIALRADISRSTLTRFMNDPDITTVLSGPIVAAIERAFAAPVSFGMAEPEVAMLPPLNDADAIELGPNRHRWRIGERFTGLPGYLPGDYLLAEMGLEPRNGDDVLIQIENRSGATTHLRKFRKNFAMGGTDTDPEFIDGERVRVAAVVLKSWRERDG